MRTQMTYFISYTTRTGPDRSIEAENDIAWAKWVDWVLRNKLNAHTILQEYDFRPGHNFKERMHDALIRADAVVCVLTRAYLESTNCTEEWTNAKEIIPIRFDDCVPTGLLTSKVYINLYGLDKDSARDRLVTKIRGESRPHYEPDAPFASGSSSEAEPGFPILSSTSEYTTRHNLPSRNKKFTGRADILADIFTGLQDSSIVTLTGQGGFGKTQTAVEYAYIHKSKYELIWYFNAESPLRLEEDYRNFILRNLELTEMAKNEFAKVEFAVIRRYIDEWFWKNSSYLLIYDNAEGCPNLREYLPQGQTKRHILINSRERVPRVVAKRLSTTVFSSEDAVEFLQRRIAKISNNDASELAKTLGYLPLALECAASYVEESHYVNEIEQYINKLKEFCLKFLDKHPNESDYEHTILTVWKATFEKINQEAQQDEITKAALQLFKLCTYCTPEDIPFRMFVDGRDKTPQPLRDFLGQNNEPAQIAIFSKLKSYSLISWKRRDDVVLLEVHRLIQEAVRSGFEYNEQWVNCCLNIASTIFKYQYGKKDDFNQFALNLPHVLEIARHSQSFLNDDKSKEKIARIYNEAGKGLHHQGDYDIALMCYYEALDIREKVLGHEHPVTAMTYNNIAGVYHDHGGNYAIALEWYYKALEIEEKVLGHEHPATATTYNNIAGVYHVQGDYAKALEWYYKALEIEEKVLTHEHPSTATIYNNIAGVYHDQRDYAKALELNNKALDIREKVLGHEHPVTAMTYNNIAGVYHDQGDYAKARDLLCRAINILTICNLTEHPKSKRIFSMMHYNYKKAGGKEDNFETWFNERIENYPS